jgi:hypothetical protein
MAETKTRTVEDDVHALRRRLKKLEKKTKGTEWIALYACFLAFVAILAAGKKGVPLNG